METNGPTLGDDRGFVLLFVLLVIALLSLLASAFALRSRSAIDVAQAEKVDVEERYLLESATVRALRSLQFDDDTIKLAKASRVDPVRWSYAGTDVSMFIEKEGAKVDVNAADMRLVQRAVADAELSDSSRIAVLDAIGQSRTAGTVIPSVASLLPACDRLGNGAARLARSLTVVTRQKVPDGLDPNATGSASTSGSDANGGASSSGTDSPLVTVVAMTPRLEQRTLVRVLGRSPYFEVIQSVLASPGNDDICPAAG